MPPAAPPSEARSHEALSCEAQGASTLSARDSRAPFPIDAVRERFPSLARAAPFIYFDNAAGAQAPREVLARVADHLLDFNVQRGGRYPKSVEVDRVIAAARGRMATFL